MRYPLSPSYDLLSERVRLSGEPARLSVIHRMNAHTRAVPSSRYALCDSAVRTLEAQVASAPGESFVVDESGRAQLSTPSGLLDAGRFEVVSVGELKSRVRSGEERPSRLFALHGAHPMTDIGSLQANAGPGVAFQVASQFNCLEAPGAFVTPVQNYPGDPTQGPRAAYSALPGTLLRHYAAPSADGGRFTQTNGGPQVNLLDAFCDVAPVHNGYLHDGAVRDPERFAAELTERFDEIQVGVHEGVEVVYGANWYGPVALDAEGHGPRITQVFTSTLAGCRPVLYEGCRQLLRAAYLGTLLAARASGCHTVVLTLIGGGVFGNPIHLIWESIVWAVDEMARWSPTGLDVIVNGRNLLNGYSCLTEDKVRDDCGARGGVLLGLP